MSLSDRMAMKKQLIRIEEEL
ncbi:MAG: hypothetical protein IKP70_02455 [Treponema sp.]|nr:hypothetical protein [Treponema sp.]MBR4321287.1 hypothetical protein [Treponema sp.]